ncbi:XdhC/CoxI family protein [Diplocloster hominis]|uniref:XdhC/CoxI family protein n=1 Tax=Diplocloster hominis TaxID=3079010 RepID=UPI0031B9EF41
MNTQSMYQKLLSVLKAGTCCQILSKYAADAGKPAEKLFLPSESEEEFAALFPNGMTTVEETDGTVTIREPFFPEERLIILGGGHVALALVEFAARVGFTVTVVDDRPSFANTARFPLARHVICDAFPKAIKELQITAYDYVAILTRGHRYDLDCLRMILNGTQPYYLGMIGSKRRVSGIREMLRAEGCTEETLSRLCAPIGLNIGALTPEEIGISIVSQLISKRRLCEVTEAEKNHKIVNGSDVDFEVLSELAAEGRGPRAAVTVISSKGPTPRKAGAKMVVYSTGQLVGSIGGGCSEHEVIVRARKLIGTGAYEFFTVDLTGDVAEEEGMVCGGILTVLIEDLS